VLVSSSSDGTFRVWNALTGSPIGFLLQGDFCGVISLAFSPDGSKFAGATSDTTVRLWDLESRKLLASYSKDQINRMTPISFSSDGKHLTAFSVDGMTHTWDAANGQPIEGPKLCDNEPFAFRMHDDTGEALLRWFPVDHPDFGYCAYIDDKFIRTDRNWLKNVIDTSGLRYFMYTK
jgi:WD40 repeat protein